MPLPSQTLAAAIRAAGLPAKVVLSDEPELTDDMIEITDRVHVQVSHNQRYAYAMVNIESECQDPDGWSMTFGEQRRISDVDKIIADIRLALPKN